MAVSIFLPGYNEEKIVKEHLLKVYNYVKKKSDYFEIVMVDDGSKDKTPKIVGELSKEYKNIKLARFDNGPSRRENLAKAMANAKYDIVCFMDLHLGTPIHYLDELIKGIEEGNDICIGSRRLKESKVKRGIVRNTISWFYHTGLHLLFRSKISDYQCGFKAFKKSKFKLLSKEAGYDDKFIRGWFWDAEMLFLAENKRMKIKEIPIEWNARKESRFNMKRELKMLKYVFSLALKHNKKH